MVLLVAVIVVMGIILIRVKRQAKEGPQMNMHAGGKSKTCKALRCHVELSCSI